MASMSFHVPVAIILLGGGLLACFVGYRLLRTLLGLYGFIAGVVVATLLVSEFETWVAILLTLGGGLLGAVVAVMAYLAGVAILGAGLGALALNVRVHRPRPQCLVCARCMSGRRFDGPGCSSVCAHHDDIVRRSLDGDCRRARARRQ